MTSEELAALDAAQMEEDMARANVSPGVWRFPRVLTELEATKVHRFLVNKLGLGTGTLTYDKPDGSTVVESQHPILVDGKPL